MEYFKLNSLKLSYILQNIIRKFNCDVISNDKDIHLCSVREEIPSATENKMHKLLFPVEANILFFFRLCDR